MHSLWTISEIESSLPEIERIGQAIPTNTAVRFYMMYYIEYQCTRLFGLLTSAENEPEPFHYGKHPDIIHCLHLCNFFNDNRPPGIPILHILSKALPQRCQYRNLKEICMEYCKKERGVLDWLKVCIECSLGGYYPHCEDIVPFWVRISLYQGCIASTKKTWIRWIERNGYLLFYIIKEYLVFAVRYEPALYEVVCGTYYWEEFEQTTKKAMRAVRRLICMNMRRAAKNVFSFCEHELLKYNSYQLQYLYKIPNGNNHRLLYDLMRQIRQMKYQECLLKLRRGRGAASSWESSRTYPTLQIQKDLEVGQDCKKMIEMIVQYRHLLPKISVLHWMHLCGMSSEAVERWQVARDAFLLRDVSKKNISLQIHRELSIRDFSILNAFICKMFDFQAVRIIRLPKHWYINQYQALQKRMVDGTEYICRACKTFKSFIVRPTPADIHFYAIGHDKIMYDDDHDKYFCGRKIVRHQNQKRNKKKHQTDEHLHNQMARSIRRRDESMDCADTELLSVPMLGNMVQCYDKLYVLCPMPQCGRPCRFEFYKTSFLGTFSCGRCRLIETESETFCGYCGEDTTKACASYIIEDQGVEKKIFLCPRHNMRQFRAGRWTKKDMWYRIQLRLTKQYG